MALCVTPEEVRIRAAAGEVIYPGALAPLVDTRIGFRAERPGTIWSELFHKKRAYIFGDTVRTHHVVFSSSPIVSSQRSTFGSRWEPVGRHRATSPRRGERLLANAVAACAGFSLQLDRWFPASLAEDVAYWEQGEEHRQLLLRAATALGLQVMAIDYSSLADGGILLWEANPYFCISPEEYRLPRQRRMVTRLSSYFDSLAQFFSLLLEGTIEPVFYVNSDVANVNSDVARGRPARE